MKKDLIKMSTNISISELKFEHMNYNWEWNINGVSDTYKGFKQYYKAISKDFLTEITKELNKEFKANKINVKAKYIHGKDFVNIKNIKIELYTDDRYHYENREFTNTVQKVIKNFRAMMYNKRENKEIDFVIVI